MAGKEGPLPGIDLEHYVRLLLRQKWFVILPCIMGVALMAFYSMTLTNLYTATSTVLVEPPALPKEFMKRTVEYGPETYVRTLVEQVKSVSRLEKVINEYNLYSDMRDRGKTIEEIVGHMRNQIEIVRRGSDTFSISYTGDEPQKVQDVTNRLADLFIEENVNFRLQKSEKNVALLDSQAKKLRDEVMAQERVVEEFKAKNLDRLPEQQAATQTQLGAAQQQLESNSQALASARIRASNLQQRLNSLSPTVVVGHAPATSADRKALEKAQTELATLKVQYSDRHPDVKLKQAEVDALQAAMSTEVDATSVAPKRRLSYSAEYRRTEEELNVVQAEIARMEGEDERLRARVDDLNDRLEAMPAIGLKLSELTNGLAVRKDQADAYQKKATDAFASLAMEESNQGSQFRSLDRARKPSKPISPNRPILVLLGGVAGLGLGVVLMIGLDVLFRPFLDEQDLARFTGVQVLVSIPQVGPFPSEWQRFRGQMSSLIRFLIGSLSPAEARYHSVGLSLPASLATRQGNLLAQERADNAAQRENGPSARGPGKMERSSPPLRKIRPVTTVLRGKEDEVPWSVPPRTSVPDESPGQGGRGRKETGRVHVGQARATEPMRDRPESGVPPGRMSTERTGMRAADKRPRLVAPAAPRDAGGWARTGAPTNTYGEPVDSSEGRRRFGSVPSKRLRYALASSPTAVEEPSAGEITQEIPPPPSRTADRKS